MTVLEFFITTNYVFKQLKEYKINSADLNYVDMVREYNNRIAEGGKPSNVKALMSRKYKLTSSVVQSAIKRLNRNI